MGVVRVAVPCRACRATGRHADGTICWECNGSRELFEFRFKKQDSDTGVKKMLKWIPELWHTLWIWIGRWFVDRQKEKRRDDWHERRRKRREERKED